MVIANTSIPRGGLHNHALVCSGGSRPARSVQQPTAEEPSQQVELRQLPLLGQLMRRRRRVRAWREEKHRTTSAYDRRNHTGTKYFTTHAKTHTTTPSPLLCISPLFKFMAVVCKIYLCMYLYSIYVLVGHKTWFSAFCFYFEGCFYFNKCAKITMLNHEVEYT